MTVSDAIRELVELHKEAQADGGYDDAESVSANSIPLSNLKGFDSLLIPPMIRGLGRKLGHPLKKGERLKNLYRVEGENQTIRQVAEQFCNLYAKVRVAV